MKLLAAQINIGPPGGFKGIGPLGNITGDEGAVTMLAKFIRTAIGVLTLVAIIWFVFNFFIGAIGLISAGGDKASVESSRKRITNSLIGLVVTILAVVITGLIGYLLGIPNMLDLLGLYRLISQ